MPEAKHAASLQEGEESLIRSLDKETLPGPITSWLCDSEEFLHCSVSPGKSKAKDSGGARLL